jgi:hypothetical protein
MCDINIKARSYISNHTSPQAYRYNFQKANWSKFKSELDLNCSNVRESTTPDENSLNKSIIEAILRAAEISIPKASINKNKRRTPCANSKLDKKQEKS